MSPNAQSRIATRMGGWSLVLAAFGFMGLFTWLGARFDYPAVLDGSAADVLPRLLALGTSGRAVWALYAFLPLLLIPAGVGARAALKHAAPNAMDGALVLAVLAAVAMLIGLARWPSIHWELARTYSIATPDAREALDAVFIGLNLFLGNYIGEFLGELAMNGFFVLTGYAALSPRFSGYRFGAAAMIVGAAGVVGAFRNVTALVAPVAAVNNYVLALWLVAMGVVLLRWPTADPEVNAALSATNPALYRATRS